MAINTELLDHFDNHGISHDAKRNGLDKVIEFQDMLGRQSIGQTAVDYIGLDSSHRKTFLWACMHCLDQDTAMAIWDETRYAVNIDKIMELESENRGLRRQLNP